MTFKQLVRELCRREKLKKQIDVAQVTELLGHLADIIHADTYDDQMIVYMLDQLGQKRAKKKAKK